MRRKCEDGMDIKVMVWRRAGYSSLFRHEQDMIF